jgi:hypothetical protein
LSVEYSTSHRGVIARGWRWSGMGHFETSRCIIAAAGPPPIADLWPGGRRFRVPNGEPSFPGKCGVPNPPPFRMPSRPRESPQGAAARPGPRHHWASSARRRDGNRRSGAMLGPAAARGYSIGCDRPEIHRGSLLDARSGRTAASGAPTSAGPSPAACRAIRHPRGAGDGAARRQDHRHRQPRQWPVPMEPPPG